MSRLIIAYIVTRPKWGTAAPVPGLDTITYLIGLWFKLHYTQYFGTLQREAK